MGYCILLVDDSVTTRGLIKRTIQLAGLPVSEFLEAGNGKEALEKLRTHAVDLMLADLNMPEMNGIELLTMVKRTGMAKCPVIVISTRDNLPVLEEAVKNQVATHFVVKPWNLRQMWDLIARILPE